MQPKDLAKLLKDFRAKSGLSQGQVAEKLGITQANVSRIEAGIQQPRQAFINRIIELAQANPFTQISIPLQLEQRSKDSDQLVFEEKHGAFKSDWNYFQASRSFGQSGGDILLVKELEKNNKLGVLVGDSVGHGNNSAYMSFAIEFSYMSIASLLSPAVMTPDIFDKAIAAGVVKTANSWRGEPSMVILQVDLEKSHISFINRGMPYPVLIEDEGPRLMTKRREGAYALQKKDAVSAITVNEQLGQGQSIFLYSDGLLDLMAEDELISRIQKLNKLFKGDSRALGRNLIRFIKQISETKRISDDISFLILSRFKKGRQSGPAS